MRQISSFIFLLVMSEFVTGQVYSADKKFEYDITYFQNQENLSTHETITLTMTGRKWKWSENQLEGVWTYFTKPKTEKKFQKQKTIGWLKVDTTGIIENENKVWLHPPRHNQYLLTEISPFPDFRKNLKIGDSYNMFLSIGKGFGDWTDKKIKFSYVIKNIEQQSDDTLWTTEASSQLDGKSNNCKFIFSEKKGFILLDYSFYNGDKLTIRLMD
jgi:hypothetical protein